MRRSRGRRSAPPSAGCRPRWRRRRRREARPDRHTSAMPHPMPVTHPVPDHLHARRALIDTYQQPVIYMRSDCAVCRAEGFEAQAQIEVLANGRSVLAILHRVEGTWLEPHDAALSDAAWLLLGVSDGDPITGRPAPQL